MGEKFLITKHGLFYKPDDAGYTGVKAEAGRYALDQIAVRFPNMDSPNQDGIGFVAEHDAPEFSTACWSETKLSVRDAQIKELRAKLHDIERSAQFAQRHSLSGDLHTAMTALSEIVKIIKRET